MRAWRPLPRVAVALLGATIACLGGLATADDEGIGREGVTLRLADASTGADRDRIEAWAENRLAGPVEILLETTDRRTELASEPALPVRTVLPAFERRLLVRVGHGNERGLRLLAVPGAPDARPRDIEYGYPLRTSVLRIEQGWGGRHSHHDAENRHAVDFATAIGTPVLAARAGTVMDVESRFEGGGLDAGRDTARANFVRIVHDDGTMALYAHLKSDGALVRVGQRVRKGEVIGVSGNTGFSAGPHLHFVVQVNRGMRLESIPFRMFGPQGILRFAEPR